VILSFAACQETGSASRAAKADLVRAPDVPITILAVDGIPEAINEAMLDSLAEAATQRGIELVSIEKKPRYQIKGYFSAASTETGTELSYVWDVLDTSLAQSSRVEGSAASPRQTGDPWAVLDAEAMALLSSQSMNDLAAFLVRSESAAS
jgi:LDH2 family malate/lactate/ureidoglycolate dehydrogenase